MTTPNSVKSVLGRAQDLLTSASVADLVARFEGQLQPNGAIGFVVTAFPSRAGGHTHAHVDERLRQWVEVYERERLFEHCPMTAYNFEKSVPTTIEDIAAAHAPDTPAGRVMQMARDMHVAYGILVPVHRRNGDKAAVGIVTEEPIEDCETFLEMNMLSVAFQARFDELTQQAEANASAPLTAREIEVLRWLADGKSAEDVAAILNLSVATVMFHQNNASRRLGTLNRTHTVTEALRRGLLS